LLILMITFLSPFLTENRSLYKERSVFHEQKKYVSFLC
jgi:hypothetical protein